MQLNNAVCNCESGPNHHDLCGGEPRIPRRWATGGYQLIEGKRVPLPIGSSLKRGVFYWQPGPGFLGDYTLVFERPDGTEAQVRVKIRPKMYTR